MVPTVCDGEEKREKGFLTDYFFRDLPAFLSQNTQQQQEVKWYYLFTVDRSLAETEVWLSIFFNIVNVADLCGFMEDGVAIV